MRRILVSTFLLVAASVVPSLVAGAEERLAVPGEHMEVEATDTCDGCHAELTPEIHAEWFASRHGLNNVKCFVCHGAIGENFMRQPAPERCVGCHFEQVESLQTPFMEGKGCFSCHPSHALSPHAAGDSQGGSE